MPKSRRKFIKQSALIGSAIPFAKAYGLGNFNFTTPVAPPPIYIFSKHLQFLSYPDMAKAALDLGFDGVELTVREGGHVNPDEVEKQLPNAVDAVKNADLRADMMVSDITGVNDRSRRVLKTAANLGIKKYRLGYFDYADDATMPESIARTNEIGSEIAALNRELGIQGMHQNHAGDLIGSSVWEIWMLLKDIDPKYLGSQYDIRHAMVEGGMSWPNGIRLLKDRISSLAIKDFKWEKVDGDWELINTPLGTGMVDFIAYFKLLKNHQINVPITLHYEYDLFGAEHGQKTLSADKRPKVYEAMERDLAYLRTTWNEV